MTLKETVFRCVNTDLTPVPVNVSRNVHNPSKSANVKSVAMDHVTTLELEYGCPRNRYDSRFDWEFRYGMFPLRYTQLVLTFLYRTGRSATRLTRCWNFKASAG
jgi:hypothetical protein